MKPVTALAIWSIVHLSHGQNLVLIGGTFGDDIYKKMIELSGGVDVARIGLVTAASNTPQADAIYYTAKLQQFGAAEVYWVPVTTRNKTANVDPDVVSNIERMTGIFFCGGDSRFILKAFYNNIEENHGGRDESPALTAIKDVFARGGMVGGDSAGCMSQTSDVMIATGRSWNGLRDGSNYTSDDISIFARELTYNPLGGMGLINDVIIDVHFSERGRHGRLIRLIADVMEEYGIDRGFGVDEGTALVVYNVGQEGSYGEVLGPNGVWFADLRRVVIDDSGDNWSVANVGTHYLTGGDTIMMDTWDITIADWKSNIAGEEEDDEVLESENVFNDLRDGGTEAEYRNIAYSLFNTKDTLATTGRSNSSTEGNPRYEAFLFKDIETDGFIGFNVDTGEFQISYTNLTVDMYAIH